MPPDLHVHPDLLAAHAVTAAGLSEELRAALVVAPEPGTGDEERVCAAVRRAVGALAELGAALAAVAAEHEAADRGAARGFEGLLR